VETRKTRKAQKKKCGFVIADQLPPVTNRILNAFGHKCKDEMDPFGDAKAPPLMTRAKCAAQGQP
jgi:hypothetical protein